MKFNWFVGIDASKKTLDITIRKKECILRTLKIENSVSVLKSFLKELKNEGLELSDTLFAWNIPGFIVHQ